MGDDEASREVSRILQAVGRDVVDDEALWPLVYERLRGIARARMAGERSDHTLGATALVNEAWLRLAGGEPIPWAGKAHFFHVAAEVMRRVLIDHARGRKRIKRGGGRAQLPLDAVQLAAREDPTEFLAVEEALRRLEKRDERAAEVAKLRFFAGLSSEETAQVLGISVRSVHREWAVARAWLQLDLPGEQPWTTGNGVASRRSSSARSNDRRGNDPS